MNIGAKLKRYREAKEISIYRLAQLSDIAQNNIQRMEDEISVPTIETLQKIIPHLGLTLSELFNESEEYCFVTTIEKEYLQILRTLNQDQQTHIIQTMKFMKKI